MVSIPNLHEFADDHEEQHAIGTGVGLGFAAVASGETRALGVAVNVGVKALERKRRPEPADGQNLRNDVLREAHYFLGGLAVGAMLGIVARIVTGQPVPF